MANFIKLHKKSIREDEILVNKDLIAFLEPVDGGKNCNVYFCSSNTGQSNSMTFLNVKESYREVCKLLES